jgi:hypothetical protein
MDLDSRIPASNSGHLCLFCGFLIAGPAEVLQLLGREDGGDSLAWLGEHRAGWSPPDLAVPTLPFHHSDNRTELQYVIAMKVLVRDWMRMQRASHSSQELVPTSDKVSWNHLRHQIITLDTTIQGIWRGRKTDFKHARAYLVLGTLIK